ncbi:YeaH/YhbH family protein [Paraferrimonas sp. SM1919]|uniref:YeaH/YhbH family protein n=1 Tax=Paraferrimonas sp. SM1919 TaxID=2662263 RepID=UPI0013D13A24|nr:YeaH/YhbH family protein [Paraferrimonas sp. SM1919]
MTHFIDRRLNAKGKSTVNRQRFLRRYQRQIKKSVSDAVTGRSVTDVDSGESVSIPTKDIKEPYFRQGIGGIRQRIFPGNDQYIAGDKIERPPQGGGTGSGGSDASDSGEGKDEFAFEVSKDEYLDILFEDLALPNMHQTEQSRIVEYKTRRAGFTNDGVPSNLNIVRSLKSSIGRRLAMTANKKAELKALELALQQQSQPEKIQELEQQIAALKRKIKAVPFIDSFDLRYNNFNKYPVPSSQAVMFCLMDVSGSMDQATKDIAKRFYILLFLFLNRRYQNLEVVFIRHHTQAKEVDEHEFFYSQETGGTIVSSALKLMHEIQQSRYPSQQWNVYVAQASDGDNWADDSPTCHQVLEQKILPHCRYYSYIEITNRAHQSLWREYEKLAEKHSHFTIKHILGVENIFPVFRELFQKQTV